MSRASIEPLSPAVAAAEIEKRWWTGNQLDRKQLAGETDRGWSWAKIAHNMIDDDSHECLALRSDDGAVQSACVYNVFHSSQIREGERAVLLILLAAAPWNRPWLTVQPKYRGAGTALTFRCVCHSYILGLKGRVVVEANVSERTLAFYRSRGFIELGSAGPDTMWMEIPEAAAKSWIDREMGHED